MDFTKLKNNLISVIKESQIKLGYDSMGIGVFYVESSLAHLLNDADKDKIATLLAEFAEQNSDIFGDIEVQKTSVGYRLNVSSKGADYVHNMMSDDDFLVRFIDTIRSSDCTIEKVVELFKQYSDNVVVQELDNGEFDYLIYFADGKPDEFWYCIDTDDLGVTYHRFTKEDYLDFEF